MKNDYAKHKRKVTINHQFDHYIQRVLLAADSIHHYEIFVLEAPEIKV